MIFIYKILIRIDLEKKDQKLLINIKKIKYG